MQLVKSMAPENYESELASRIETQFSRSVAQYDLAEMPSNLVLEDLVGTSIGLEGLFTKWTGAIKVTDLHRTAD